MWVFSQLFVFQRSPKTGLAWEATSGRFSHPQAARDRIRPTQKGGFSAKSFGALLTLGWGAYLVLIETLGHGVTVAQLTLDQLVQVRILVPQLAGGVRSRQARRRHAFGCRAASRFLAASFTFAIKGGMSVAFAVKISGTFVSAPEAAKELGMTPSRVYQMLQAGEISGIRAGRSWLIPVAEVKRLKAIPKTTGRPRISER